MKIIENKKEYTAVDLLAKEIAKAADFNANKYEYDKTFISLIYKNSTGVSDKLTDEEKNQLSECDEFWYYVRINGNFYKLECKDVSIAIDTEVKVTVPCNNWNKMFINFRKGTNTKYKRWVRPKEWLPLPKKVKSNEVYFLVKGQKTYNGILQSSFDIYSDYYDTSNSYTVDWGDGSKIETCVGHSHHSFIDLNWHWVKATFNNRIQIYYNDYCGTCVEIISGGLIGIELNNPDNYCNVLEHIVCGCYLCNFSWYGLHNLQCIEFIPDILGDNNETNGAIECCSCYDCIVHESVKYCNVSIFGWSALKYFGSKSLENCPSFSQCFNLEEIYLPNCIDVSNINDNLDNNFNDNLSNLKKITLNKNCVINPNSWLATSNWIEKCFV